MTLMKLAPECVRLRRMARAHAAGEMTEAEYRRGRREVIDGFPSQPPADDDTRPRWGDEPTLRNDARPYGQSAAASVDADAGNGRRWLWLMGAALVLAAAMLTLPTAWAAVAVDSLVPPVRERHPDPANSPRLSVTSVRVAWGESAVAAPAGVALDALQAAADAALAREQARNTPGAHGFTPSELDEVARLLKVLGVHDPQAGLDAADARDLTALIREQKQRRGVSVAQLEAVALAVQVALRQAGYFLGVAYVPAQQVADGRARIDVLPGRIGDIMVEGGDPGPVTGTFAPLIDQPVTLDQVSSRLQALNALPGFTAQASFGPGEAVGESQLRLDLVEQRRWAAAAAVDNHGDAATGEQRFSVSGAWLNPRRVGDRLGAGALLAVNPANQSYGYLDYDTPFLGGYRLSARLGNNDFSQDDPLELEGDGVFLDLLARRDLIHRRARGRTLVFGVSRQSLDWDDGVEQSVTLGSAGLIGYRVWDGPQIAADAVVNATVGHVGGDRFVGQDDLFWLLELDAAAWTPVSWFGGAQQLELQLAGQWSDSLLPATRRFALGGAYRARAFDRSAFLADRGVLLSLELRQPLTLGELLAFVETGYGDGRADDAENWASLTDLGLGWEAELVPGLSTRLSWALPITAKGTGDFDDDGARFYWSLRYDH